MSLLRIEGPKDVRELDRDALVALADRKERGMPALGFRALAGDVADADHATFHASDGYAASIPLEQALRDAVILVPPAEAGKVGVRLIVSQGGTTCLNVKAVERVELTRGPGKHTVDPNPHEPAFVPGWDEYR
jgi:hypothetical protein